MAHPYKATKPYWPNTQYNDSVGRSRNAKSFPRPKNEEAPEDPNDKRGPDYDNNVPTDSWLDGGAPAESKPGYFRTGRGK